ncbi:hypothetical protein MVEN_02455400 [Mycena venus]|uniref:Secreted protein n=1 Tax=Mycena venus TaxID=2733690 RepID=A0A8H6WX87_9AGAR|nr:hypothetical protein MVEN_02455400 [Mycena venus]
MHFTFTVIVVVATTLTSAAIISRNNRGNASKMSFPDESSLKREIEGRKGGAHSREFLLYGDSADIPQRRSTGTYQRRHPRDFHRSELYVNGEGGNDSRTPSRRHPRDFARGEDPEDVEVRNTNTPRRRVHPRQFRSFD